LLLPTADVHLVGFYSILLKVDIYVRKRMALWQKKKNWWIWEKIAVTKTKQEIFARMGYLVT
jgi:hypothetical protein